MAMRLPQKGRCGFHATLFEDRVLGPAGLWGEVEQKVGRAPPLAERGAHRPPRPEQLLCLKSYG